MTVIITITIWPNKLFSNSNTTYYYSHKTSEGKKRLLKDIFSYILLISYTAIYNVCGIMTDLHSKHDMDDYLVT